MNVNIEMLEKAIDNSGMSKAEFATRIGMTESTYYRKRQSGFEKMTVGEMHRTVDVLAMLPSNAREIFLP